LEYTLDIALVLEAREKERKVTVHPVAGDNRRRVDSVTSVWYEIVGSSAGGARHGTLLKCNRLSSSRPAPKCFPRRQAVPKTFAPR
jgi:hypothetical protein